jgi:acyl-CoA reductase-like NAD-dependent aldehyde dehydrogenase
MNDSPYGLTASVWTSSQSDFLELVDSLEAGTVFQNRCDYLDPALAWTGVKHSGRGISLSKFGELSDGNSSQLANNFFPRRL